MALVEALRDHRTGDGLGELIYSDFSGGLNDTSSPISLSDKEVAIAENVDFDTEVKAFSSRTGTKKVNDVSFAANVTDGFSWTVGAEYKKCIVMNKALYGLDPETGSAVKKIKLHGDEIYPWVMYNRLYFGDGEELYVWGDFDHTTELEETIDVTYDEEADLGTIIRYNGDDTNGIHGHFYMSLKKKSDVEVASENYLADTDWRDVTDIPEMISSVVRPLLPADGSHKEEFTFEVLTGINAVGSIAFCLDDEFYRIEFKSLEESAGGAAVTTVQGAVAKIKASLLEFADFRAGGKWELYEPGGNSFKIVARDSVTYPDAFIDPGKNSVFGAIIEISYRTTAQGMANQNNLDPIRKCTMFWMHNGSMRVFAGGNPKDNALYYSGVGTPDSWNSDIDKVYPGSGYGAITGLVEMNSYLLVSYQNGWYAWSGVDPIEDARWEQLSVPYGCVCHRSIALTPHSFTFLARDGIYAVQASILSMQYMYVTGRSYINRISEGKVEKAARGISNYKNCRGVFWENSYYLAYGYLDEKDALRGVNDKANRRVLKYEWSTKAWTVYTGWNVNQWMTDAIGLYFCTDNFVLKANEGHSDIDTQNGEKKAIFVKVRTKDFTLYSPFKSKEIRLAGFVFKQFGDHEDSTTDVMVRAGYKQFKISDIDTNESLVWGRRWGKRWGYREAQVKIAEIAQISDTFSFEFTHAQIDRPVALLALGFAYRTIRRILPQDEGLLKDRVLGTSIMPWR